jgi:hypothetical protein
MNQWTQAQKNGRDPAFAAEHTQGGNGHSGLTKREYIATACLAALLGKAMYDANSPTAANAAVKFADHLLEALNDN